MHSDRPATNREVFAAVQERARAIGDRQELGLTGTRAGWVGCRRIRGRAEDEFAADVHLCALRTLSAAQMRLYKHRGAGASPRLMQSIAGLKFGELESVLADIDDALGQAYRESGLWPVSRYFDSTPAKTSVVIEIRVGGLHPPLHTSEAA